MKVREAGGGPPAWQRRAVVLLVWALVLRSTKPALYEAIGKGVEGGKTEVAPAEAPKVGV